MNTHGPHPLRNVMIPWVITLLALFGWNALAPEQGRIRKGDFLGEIGLSQLSDEPEIACRVVNPEVFLPAGCASSWMEPGPVWKLVLISEGSSLPKQQVPAGGARGRAPPIKGAAFVA